MFTVIYWWCKSYFFQDGGVGVVSPLSPPGFQPMDNPSFCLFYEWLGGFPLILSVVYLVQPYKAGCVSGIFVCVGLEELDLLAVGL